MRWHRQMAMTALILATVAATARADRVYLADGGILTGTILQLANGSLTLSTDYSGKIPVDASKVIGFTTDKPMAAELTSGDVSIGRLVYAPQANQQKIGPDDRPITTEATMISALWAPGTDSPRIAAIKAEAKAKGGKWSLRVDAGIDGQTGNTERINVNGRIQAKYKTDRQRLTIYAQERYGKENGQRNVNETIGGVKLEVDLTDRWFAFGGLELEFDESEDLDLRATTTVGVGYFVIREDDQELKVRAGAGYEHASYGTGASTDGAILELGVHYFKQFNDWISFTHDTTYYPSLDDLGDYRILMENAVEMALNNSKSLGLRAGLRNTYDGKPLPGIDNMDTFYFLNMFYTIK